MARCRRRTSQKAFVKSSIGGISLRRRFGTPGGQYVDGCRFVFLGLETQRAASSVEKDIVVDVAVLLADMKTKGHRKQVEELIEVMSEKRCDASAVMRAFGNGRNCIYISQGRWEGRLLGDGFERFSVFDNASGTMAHASMYKKTSLGCSWNKWTLK